MVSDWYNPPYGTCDWGECDEPATEWRWSENDLVHLPVCEAHELETELGALRESHAALLAAAKAMDEFYGYIHDESAIEDDRYAVIMDTHGSATVWKWRVRENLRAAIQGAEAL